MTLASMIALALAKALRDVVPIAVAVLFFQLIVLRRPIENWQRVGAGALYMVLGLAFFLVGLELALFPLGESMAKQLASPAFLGHEEFGAHPPEWNRYYWMYLFAFCIGFGATLAEPAFLAMALKAHEASGGTIQVLPLRIAAALGSGVGVMLGTIRIVTGMPIFYLLLVGYLVVVYQVLRAPKAIVPLGCDSGPVTTSTIIVPMVTTMGIGLAAQVPGRDPVLDGFGILALAVMFPIISVMGYAQLASWWLARSLNRQEK